MTSGVITGYAWFIWRMQFPMHHKLQNGGVYAYKSAIHSLIRKFCMPYKPAYMQE